jgi:DNA polymerase III delta prime subunit
MQHITSSEIKARSGTTWLIYGQPGVGKTPFASCFPEPWIWDCEGGTGSVIDDRPVQITTIESYADIMALVQVVQAAPTTHIKLSSKEFPCKTIVVDTVGEYARIIIGSAKGTKETATLPDWGVMVERVRNTTRALRNARDKGFNIVFICHEQYLTQSETSMVLGMPDLPGKELPNDLPKLCDVVCRMRVRRNPKGELERILVTAPDGQFIGRDRFGRLDETEVIPPFTKPDEVRKLIAKAGVTY